MSQGGEAPLQRAGLRVERRDDHFVLVDPSSVEVCSINETAEALWELCDGETTLDEMVDAICAVCSVGRDDAVSQVDGVLAKLTEMGALEWKPRPRADGPPVPSKTASRQARR